MSHSVIGIIAAGAACILLLAVLAFLFVKRDRSSNRFVQDTTASEASDVPTTAIEINVNRVNELQDHPESLEGVKLETDHHSIDLHDITPPLSPRESREVEAASGSPRVVSPRKSYGTLSPDECHE
jgi:hypothetical protein